MSEKITRKLIENQLLYASENAGTRFFVDWNGQRGTVQFRVADYNHNITKELTKDQLLLWIEGFHEGVRCAKRNFSNRVK